MYLAFTLKYFDYLAIFSLCLAERKFVFICKRKDLLTIQACILLLDEENLKKKTSVILIAKLSHFNINLF